LPESWIEGIVVPIVKSGERRKVEDHRGVTIMSAIRYMWGYWQKE